MQEKLERGILIGCDVHQEWLLSWWWDHYSKHNSYPVAFANFGLSERGLDWCRERGQLIDLPGEMDLKPLLAANQVLWEERLGEGIWLFRSAWFKKPLAFLCTPFPVSCWIDLDCEIQGNLGSLFDILKPNVDIALTKDDPGRMGSHFNEITYNSGVVLFRQGAEVIRHWVEMSRARNDEFVGDQDVLSRAIALHRPLIEELPAIYNWKKCSGPNPNAVIVHYVAASKLLILKSLYPSLQI